MLGALRHWMLYIARGLEGAVGAIMIAVIGVHGQGGRELR